MLVLINYGNLMILPGKIFFCFLLEYIEYRFLHTPVFLDSVTVLTQISYYRSNVCLNPKHLTQWACLFVLVENPYIGCQTYWASFSISAETVLDHSSANTFLSGTLRLDLMVDSLQDIHSVFPPLSSSLWLSFKC